MQRTARSYSSVASNEALHTTKPNAIPDPTLARAVRLIIASSVRLVREGLVLSLRDRSDLILIDSVNLDAAGLARVAETKPDLVLLDLARANATQCARLLNAASPNSKLVAFALAEVNDDVFDCAAAGFSGYVPSESGADELYHALLDAAVGRLTCSPHITAALFDRLSKLLREKELHDALPALTSREREVLSLTEKGFSNKEIARRLVISSATVKNHMHNILQKLQVSRRGQAVARLRAGRDT